MTKTEKSAKKTDLPSLVGVEVSRALARQRPTADSRPRPTVRGRISARFIFLDSRIEDFDSRFRSSTCCLPIAFVYNLIIARLDYSQGCSELEKEEQSRASN
ncbi:hypothetical protein M9H77_03048 [Catharanthus roseus]|uniref:Uncharacterized protein n=1 Tax=Catharanthus roseus TaxID=4058 RepID=A0ACC0CAB1_CATRO|nr:hypothetical protein M9H77_03048 [Catharanthus roseus]